MEGVTCRVSGCNLQLVKQYLYEGKALSTEQKNDLRFARLTDACTLECEVCRGPCYHTSLEWPTSAPESGRGICTDCGGNNTMNRPDGFFDQEDVFPIIKKYGARIWSCPLHGLGQGKK